MAACRPLRCRRGNRKRACDRDAGPVRSTGVRERAARSLVRESLVAVLRDMPLDEFRRVRRLEAYDVTPEWVVHHLLQHEAEHRGQIALLRRGLA